MSFSTLDEEQLAAIRPLDLAAYLRANGWVEVDPSATPMTAWERMTARGRTEEILAPLHQHWRDYAKRVHEALEVLSRIEERSAASVAQDISEITFDILRVRAVTSAAAGGSIQLMDGIRLAECANQSLLAAACAAVEPRRAYHTRKPKRVLDYASGLRLAQTEHGSYVIRVLSPVTPALTPRQESLPFPEGCIAADEDQPFERAVTTTLAVALNELTTAAVRGAASGSLEAFEAAVPRGVSADLCEAIGNAVERPTMSRIEMRITWSGTRAGPRDIPARTSFSMDTIEVIREAGRLLREKAPIDDFELEGYVIDLSRPDPEPAGVATVAATVGGTSRKVSVPLRGMDWRAASEALDQRLVFRCEGELYRDSKPFLLRNPRNVRNVRD